MPSHPPTRGRRSPSRASLANGRARPCVGSGDGPQRAQPVRNPDAIHRADDRGLESHARLDLRRWPWRCGRRHDEDGRERDRDCGERSHACRRDRPFTRSIPPSYGGGGRRTLRTGWSLLLRAAGVIVRRLALGRGRLGRARLSLRLGRWRLGRRSCRCFERGGTFGRLPCTRAAGLSLLRLCRVRALCAARACLRTCGLARHGAAVRCACAADELAFFVCPGASAFPRATPFPGTVTPRGATWPRRCPGCSQPGGAWRATSPARMRRSQQRPRRRSRPRRPPLP